MISAPLWPVGRYRRRLYTQRHCGHWSATGGRNTGWREGYSATAQLPRGTPSSEPATSDALATQVDKRITAWIAARGAAQYLHGDEHYCLPSSHSPLTRSACSAKPKNSQDSGQPTKYRSVSDLCQTTWLSNHCVALTHTHTDTCCSGQLFVRHVWFSCLRDCRSNSQ